MIDDLLFSIIFKQPIFNIHEDKREQFFLRILKRYYRTCVKVPNSSPQLGLEQNLSLPETAAGVDAAAGASL
jgi:hypothetical protein